MQSSSYSHRLIHGCVSFFVLFFVLFSISISTFFTDTQGTTYHNITIDGSISDWNTDELLATRNSCKFYTTWNETHIFFAWNGTNWACEGDLHVYLNVSSGGSSTSKDWNGVHTLPFEADYLFWIEDSNANNFGLEVFSGTWTPNSMNGVSQYIGWNDNKNTEIAIPRSLIGNPAKIGVIAYALWENEGKAWNAFPVENPATQTGSETFIAYYLFDLSSGLSPNECQVVNTQQNTMNADGSFNDWLLSYNESTPWDRFLISWNETHLFIGWNGTSWTNSGDLMLYFNTTNGGSSQGVDWSGVHTLPFQADYLFWIEDGNAGCFGLKRYENGWIQSIYTGNSYIGWANNQNTELFIPFSNLGLPSRIDIVAFAQWETSCNVWRAYPQANAVFNSGQQAFTDYYSCNLQNSPNTISIVSDTILPTVSILYPSNGEVIVSSEYTIKVSANDNIAIAKVEISIDSLPYENMTWNSFEAVYYYTWLGYSAGSHTINARARDAKGNEKTASITVTYSPGGTDTVPPTVYIDYPTNNEIIQSGSYEIKARAFDNVGVTSMQVNIDNIGYNSMYYISQEGRWGYLWSGYSIGSHNITVKGFDAAGNNGTQTVQCFYDPNLVDTTPPTVTIDYPTPGEIITTSSYVIKARASDNVGINTVQIRIDSGNWQNMNWNSYELRWTYAWSDYSEGSHTIAVRVSDYAGNNATATVSVTYTPSSTDNIKPVVYIDYPTPGEIIVSPSYKIKAHATDNVGVTLLQVAIDTGAWNNMWYDSYEDRWAFHWEYYSEGVHSITVRAFDAAGNNGSATVSCTYSTTSQDTTPPIVSIDYPSPGEALISSTYEIKVRANDNVGVIRVAISIDDNDYSDMVKVGEYYVYSWTNYNPGSHNITVKAWDAANNVGTAFVIVTYTPSGEDTIPPQVFVESPTPNQIITMSGFPIRARVSDNVGVASVKVRIDQSVWLDMTLSNGVWNYFWSTYNEGMHNISVRATDLAGNNATATVSCFYYVDKEYPNLVILSHSDGQQVTIESITLSGSASDDIGIQLVEACLNPSGSTYNWVNCSGTTFWVVKLTLSEGNNVIVIKATDLAGKSTNKTITIRCGSVIEPDVTPPIVSFSAPANNSIHSTLNITFSGNVSDDRMLASLVIIYTQQTDNPNTEEVNITDRIIEYTWRYTHDFKNEGIYTVTIIAKDTSGNIASSTLSITIKLPSQNKKPSLSMPTRTPTKGTTSTTFSFKVTYTDEDGSNANYVNIIIDTLEHNMSYMSGNVAQGAIFEYRTKLKDGLHTYYFKCSDGIEVTSLDDSGLPFSFKVEKPKSSPGYNALLVSFVIMLFAYMLAKKRI